ncbi:MAG: alpha/beta hydrolase [Rhizobiaceae bacterium]|nr:alpha/beta hydrolase [Rhizobiaceae bacterium]
MTRPVERPPLLDGRVPPAPDWYHTTIAEAPERGTIPVHGVDIELLTWGEVGAPVLLFLHGKGAHADWWSFIAPFFSRRFRVAAISWSGMGRSGWREAYPEALLAEEALAALEHAGAFESSVRPLVVAHSYGCLMAAELASLVGDRLRAAVLIDPAIYSVETVELRRQRWGAVERKPSRIYATMEEALARYRFSPWQPCENLYLADYIARRSLTYVDDASGTGWRWCFDPRHWSPDRQNAIHELPRDAGVPFTIILGSNSALYRPQDVDYIARTRPPGTALVTIPEAAHHVMVDQPIALVSALRTIFAGLPAR